MRDRPSPISVPFCTMPQGKERLFNAKENCFNASAAGSGTEITLYDEIGGPFGVTAKQFYEKIKSAKGDLTVRINSPGGSFIDGVTMYNDLLAYSGKVRIEIVGVAASAASIVAMAGDEIAIADNAWLMVHRAWSLTVGNRGDHAETIGLLDQIDESMAQTYARRTNADVRVIRQMLKDETWLEGKEALAQGFATEILQSADHRAKFDLTIYSRTPDRLKLGLSTPDNDTELSDIAAYAANAARTIFNYSKGI